MNKNQGELTRIDKNQQKLTRFDKDSQELTRINKFTVKQIASKIYRQKL